MTTEAAFIVNLQHEYLRDARVRVAACLQALPDLGSDLDGVLRLHWQTTHGLKGEATVVGFPHLARYLEELENGLGAVERALGGPVGDDGTRERASLGTHACARLASALREATYGLEDYLRALEREYTDGEEHFDRLRDAASTLARWTAEDDEDWGMGAPAGLPAVADAPPSVEAPSLGEGIVFDAEVFARHKGSSLAAQTVVPSAGVTLDSPSVVASPRSAPDSVPTTELRNESPTGTLHAAQTPPAQALPTATTASTAKHDAPAHAPTSPVASGSSTHASAATATSAKVVTASSTPGQAEHDLYLVVVQEGLSYALPLGQVVEIVEARAWNPLPLPKRNILGVINLRGTVLPVCDFQGVVGRVAFALPAHGGAGGDATGAPSSAPRCIVVVSVGGRRFGVPVRGVSHVAEIPATTLTALEASGLRAGDGVVTHTALVEGRTMMIIDMGRMAA